MAGKPTMSWAPKPTVPEPGEWKVHPKSKKEYTSGGRGFIYRQGGETVEQARARVADQPPKASKVEPEIPKPKGRKKDPTPGKPSSKSKLPTTLELEAVLAELLSAPAIPAAAIWHCEYCTQHFVTEGPRTAKQLAAISEDNPAFRRLLVRLHGAWTAVTYGGVLLTYAGKPLLHHLAPDDLLATAGPLLGVPARPGPQPPPESNGQPEPQPTPAATQRGPNRPPYAAGTQTPPGA